MNTLRTNRKLVGILAVLAGQVSVFATAVFSDPWADRLLEMIAGFIGATPSGMGWANITAICITFVIFATPSLVICVMIPMLLLRSRDTETRCRKCGYILRGLSEPRCSECGERI